MPRCRHHNLERKAKVLPPAKRQGMTAETGLSLAAKAKKPSPLKVAATLKRTRANPTSTVKMQIVKRFTQAMEDQIVQEVIVHMAAVEAAEAGVVDIAVAAVEAAAGTGTVVVAAIAAEIAKISN